jgi:hypothetical protein
VNEGENLYMDALQDEVKRLTAERDWLALDGDICRDAIEAAVILVTRWCEHHDADSDAACGRVARRRLGEAIGKATPRLLMERPEGQRLYGLRYRDLIAERDRLAADLVEARELLEEWRDDGMPMTQTDLFLSRTEGK